MSSDHFPASGDRAPRPSTRESAPADRPLELATSSEYRDPLIGTDRVLAYRPDLDGFRGVLALLVLGYHIGWLYNLPGIPAAIDCFMVISGYLITGVILADHARGRFTLRRFYERRVRRIAPALFAMLLCTQALYWFIPVKMHRGFAVTVAAAAVYLNNFAIWATATLHIGGGFGVVPLIHTWSLAIEEQFYLIYPWLLTATLTRPRLDPFRTMATLTALLLGVSIVTSDSVWSYFLTSSRIWEIFFGCAIALHGGRFAAGPRLRGLMALLGVAMIALSVRLLPTIYQSHGLNVVPACVGTALLILANEDSQTPIGRLLSAQPFRFLGIASFSIYVWHWPFVVLAAQRWSWPNFPLGVQIALFAGSIGLGILSWRYLELPFRRSNGVFGPRGLFLALGASMAFFVTIGFAGFILAGPRPLYHRLLGML